MVGDLKQAETAASNNTSVNFTGSGKPEGGGEKSKLKTIAKYSSGIFAGFLVLIIAVAVALTGTPMYMLGAADYNLQQASGVTQTVAIMEDEAKYVEAEMLSKGKFPLNLANDLAEAGLTIGQVTAKGDFVRTNEYIANIDELDDLAVVGSGFEVHGNEGELAALFEGEVIEASQFADAVDANPRLYAVFSEATNIGAKYYYSDEVEKVFKEDFGISRDAYDAWRSVGDEEQDQKNFEEIMKNVLNVSSTVSGAYDCEEWDQGGFFCSDAYLAGEPEDIINGVSHTLAGAQLLDTVVASEEPYKAASAFMALEMPIQLARLDGEGPANETMNVLNRSLEVKYTDVNTGKEVKVGSSILDTNNFVAAAAGGEAYSREEANNFSFNRVLKVTTDDSSAVKKTVVSTNGVKESHIGIGKFSQGADLEKAKSSIQIALIDSNSDVFTTVIGGNRIASGGPYLSSSINQRVMFALPADQDAVKEASRYAKTVIARQKAADRATKSPFDISSPNTFMGSIVHGIANTMMQNHATSAPLTSSLGVLVSYAGDSANGLLGGAMADSDDIMFGENCMNADSLGGAANVYCSLDMTIYTGYIQRTGDEWDEKIDEGAYKAAVEKVLPRRQWAVTDSVVCESNSRLINIINELFGLCIGKPDNVRSGKEYLLSSDNGTAKKYSGYTLYDTVYSLLNEEQSTASRIMEEYYAKHPLDNSRAGIAARRSGLTKEQAQIALNYADYLAYVARYDASTRYAFGTPVIEAPEKDELVEHSNTLGGELYCFRRDGTEYGELRSRNYTV